MNKKLFTGIVVLMGISILGIIAVQLVWINNAVRVKNELFVRSVNDALNNTAGKLEDIHNFGVVNRMVFHDSVVWEQAQQHDVLVGVGAPPPPPDPNVVLDETDTTGNPHFVVRHLKTPPPRTRMEVKVDKNHDGESSFTYHFSDDDSDKNDVIVIRKNEGFTNGVVVVTSDTFHTDVDSLFNINIKIDSMLTTLDTVGFMVPDISKRVHLKAGKLKRMANKVVTEIAEWDITQIDEGIVKDVLEEELTNRNIPISFEFGILKDSVFISQQPITDSLKLTESNFQVNLYPNEIIRKNLKLVIWFPDRDSFIYRSLSWLLVASFLFSLIILFTFGLSVFYILRQKKISEMKSDFINNMTHEFKTPIATISVAADSITNEKVMSNPEKIRYFAGMIKKENSRMNRQVEDILTIARLDKKEFEFRWEQVDVHDLISDAVNGISIQVEKREGKIELNFDAKKPVVTTDKIHGTNIFYNLIDNAIKYSVNQPDIKIITTDKKDGVLVSVEDKGIGMTKAVQNRIFERFYRQTSGNVHNVKGFGLGLNYVKAVLEANHGTISVHSEPGKGSRFEVFLPFKKE
jgi:two-component system phosphate regulon sensor histidine kinase PhoR